MKNEWRRTRISDVYKDTEAYSYHHFKNEEEWKKGREQKIGGSSASSLVDLNPWKDNNALWKEHMGITVPADISKKPQVVYGKKAESYLRKLFELDFEDKYKVLYKSNCFLQSKKHGWMIYSPDGLLVDLETGKKGILEIKTTSILRSMQREKWDEQIPTNYYIQVLHGLLVTGFDFVVLKAQLKSEFKNKDSLVESISCVTKHYLIRREDVLDDLEWLEKAEAETFNKYYINKIEPSINLENILSF